MKTTHLILLSFSFGILCITGCASSRTSYQALNSCSSRGGSVQNVCTLRGSDGYSCNQYQDACVGASINVKDWCSREVAAWAKCEEDIKVLGGGVCYHPMPPSYCF